LPASPPTPIACFICGGRALLVDEIPAHADFDCPDCGRLRITGRAMFVFPPQAMQTFNRAWLSLKARAITETRRDGYRKQVSDLWLHHWRLITLLMVDYGITEADAEGHLARYPDVDMTSEAILVLVGRDLAKA